MGLRGAIWNPGAPRGLALLLEGRTEFLEKLTVPAAELAARGYAVAAVDWRGQGLSDRLVAPALKGHVVRFDDYLADLAALLAHPRVAAEGPARLVLGHSMGAAIALAARAAGLTGAAPLILSAPMAGIAITGAKGGVFRAMARGARRIGLGERWPPVPGADRPYVLQGFEGNCLTSDATFFDWHAGALRSEPRFQLGLPTLGWMAAAYDVMEALHNRPAADYAGPALVALGSREAVVDSAAVRALATRLRASLTEIDGARHDLLTEAAPLRTPFWTAVDTFLL